MENRGDGIMIKCRLKEFVTYYIHSMLKAYKLRDYLACKKNISKEEANQMWYAYMGILAQGNDWTNV